MEDHKFWFHKAYSGIAIVKHPIHYSFVGGVYIEQHSPTFKTVMALGQNRLLFLALFVEKFKRLQAEREVHWPKQITNFEPTRFFSE